jgi:hypothetical protein
MKSEADSRNADVHGSKHAESNGDGESTDREPNSLEVPFESDESSDLDEANFDDAHDERWDVFILDDDDCDPLPDYGDFWLPD